MSRRSSGMWLPPPGFLSSASSSSHIPADPRAGREATYMAHQLEESWWRNLAELEAQLLEQGQEPEIHPHVVHQSEFEWDQVFTRFVAPSWGSTQTGALLGHAVQQASEYVAALLHGWVRYVDYIDERMRERMVEAMTLLRMDAHGSAGYREQASALHGSEGTMDFGHANAAIAYTEGLRIINPAFERLQNSDPSGNFQRVQPTLGNAPRPHDHNFQSPSRTFDHGYAHISAARQEGQYPFSLPPGHYQSLGRRQGHAQDRESVYWPVPRASRASATDAEASGKAQDAEAA